METAQAYRNKGKKIQYDSYRKSYYSAPEDATSQQTIYTVCSGFTYQVYYHALGVKIPEYTETLIKFSEENKGNTDNILFYYEREKNGAGQYTDYYLDGDKRLTFDEVRENFVKLVQPGDIFVAQDTQVNPSGHAMLVQKIETDASGNKKVIALHSYGNRFNLSNLQDAGEGHGIGELLPLTTEEGRYINKSSKISLIRVITEDSSYIDYNGELKTYSGITKSAQTRLDFPGIDIEKTAVVTSSDGVVTKDRTARPGDSITYTIVITNKGTSNYSSFKIVENISNVTVTDRGNGSLNSNKLSWTVSSLAAGKNTTLTYTVQIPNDESLLGKTIVSTGSLENIDMTKIETVVEKKLTKAEKEKIVKAFEALTAESSTSKSTEKDFIDEIYMDALGLDLALGNWDLLDIISPAEGAVSTDSSKVFVKHAKINDTKFKYAIHRNFYGLRINGIIVGDGNWNYHTTELYNDRARVIISDLLDTGDVLLLRTGKTGATDKELVDKAYIYINNKLYRKTSEKLETIEDDEESSLFHFLRNAVPDNYVILRPSLLVGVDLEEEPDDVPEETPDDGEIENPVTGVIARGGILIILLFTCAAIYLFLRKKSKFPKHS